MVCPEPRRSHTQGPEAGPAWLLGRAAGLVMAEDRLPLGPATPWFSDTDSSGTDSQLISDNNRKISVMIGILLYVSGSCERYSEIYCRDINAFETNTKGSLLVVDVSINRPWNRLTFL